MIDRKQPRLDLYTQESGAVPTDRRAAERRTMQAVFPAHTDALGALSSCTQGTGAFWRAAGGNSFPDTLAARQATANPGPGRPENTEQAATDPLRLLTGYAPQATIKPEQAPDADACAKHLERKFGMRVTVKNFSRDQQSMDALGRGMSGSDLVIAPNILDEMAANKDKAQYYEEKIQYWFDSIPKWKAESAAMGLTYEPCGVAIHEDGTVYYIGGGTETPERKAQIEAAQKAKREKKYKRRQEQQEYIQRLIQIKQTASLKANWGTPSTVGSWATANHRLPDAAAAGIALPRPKQNIHGSIL